MLSDLEVDSQPMNDLSAINGSSQPSAPPGDGREKRKFQPPDGGWGWVVCAISCWTNGAVFGIINTFGLIYNQMLNDPELVNPENKDDISFKTAWVGAVTIGAVFFFSPISSILVDRFGLRQTAFVGSLMAFVGMLSSSFIKQIELLYLTYGLLMGVGSSLVYTPSLVILGHYFKAKFGLVNGIVTVGSSIFTIGLIYAIKYMLPAITLSHTLQVLSGMYFFIIIGCLAWKPLLDQRRKDLDYILSTESIAIAVTGCCQYMSEFMNVKIWHNKSYVIWVLTVAVSCFGYFISFVHLMKYAADKGMGEHAEVLILCMSILSGVARIIIGKIADSKFIRRTYLHQLGIFALGVTTLCIPWATQFWHLVLITCIMGVCDGCFVCLLGPIALDIVGPKSVSQAIGFLLGIISIPMMAGPPLAGLAYDKLGSYDIPFHCAGIPPIIGSLLMFFIPKIKRGPRITQDEDDLSEVAGAAFYGSFIWSSHMHVAGNEIHQPRGDANHMAVPMLFGEAPRAPPVDETKSADDVEGYYDDEEEFPIDDETGEIKVEVTKSSVSA